MEITVTPCADIEEMSAAIAPIAHYFGGMPKPEESTRWTRTLEPPRMHAAREGGSVVGGAGAFQMELTVPGGTVPAAGVTLVGVLPTHRRRGILRSMMRAQLDDIRERGEPVAYLWASEETIYGRFGYGMASLSGEIDLPRNSVEYALPFESRAEKRMVTTEEAYEPFSRIYDRVRRESPGMYARSEEWWRYRRFADPESRRGGGGALNRILVSLDGEPAAYAIYRMHPRFDLGVATGFVYVHEAIGATAEATRELWRALLDMDWVSRIRCGLLPVDHPLFFLLARPRMMQFRLADALWVRLVEVEAALSARTIGDGEPVVLEVTDPFCPWNDGRYAIGEGGVRRTKAEADLAMDVTALGSVYLGGFGFVQLVRGGRVEELRRGAAARADALLPRERAPWCPEIF